MPQVRDGKCGSWRAGRPPDLFANGGRYRGGNFRLLRCAVGSGDGRLNFREDLMLAGAGGPVALQTSPPVRSLSRVDTYPHAALRALLVGLRPPTPQSPERLRSTPFDCVAIAPCCFAFRKAVLSHALAALTALNKSAGQAEREALAALTALNDARARPWRRASRRRTRIRGKSGQKNGALTGTRTQDPVIKSHLLYQLSYERTLIRLSGRN